MKREMIFLLTILLFCLTSSTNTISKYLKRGKEKSSFPYKRMSYTKREYKSEFHEPKREKKFFISEKQKNCQISIPLGHSYLCKK